MRANQGDSGEGEVAELFAEGAAVGVGGRRVGGGEGFEGVEEAGLVACQPSKSGLGIAWEKVD